MSRRVAKGEWIQELVSVAIRPVQFLATEAVLLCL